MSAIKLAIYCLWLPFRYADMALILASIIRMAIGMYCDEPTCKINNPFLLMIISPMVVPVLSVVAYLYVGMWIIFASMKSGFDQNHGNDENIQDEADKRVKNCWLFFASLFFFGMIRIFWLHKMEMFIFLCSIGMAGIASVTRPLQDEFFQTLDNDINNNDVNFPRIIVL